MEILSWRRSRQIPPQRSAPHSLARTIARDETNMSTFECTRKLPQHENAPISFLIVKLLFISKHLYIFVERGKEGNITILRGFISFISFL